MKSAKKNYYLNFAPKGRVFYSGDWVNGRRTGRGRMVYTTGEEYTGEWRDNLQVLKNK